jgi:MFS family permease
MYKLVDGEQHEQREEPCNLWRRENIAIAMAYFSVGIVDSFTSTPLNIYMVGKLNAEPEMQSTIGILQALPWSLKLAFGFLSDACPIQGMRRKPYLTMGALLYSSAFVFYALCAVDNAVLLAVCIFLGTLGLIQMDVMADTMCVERSRFEPEDRRGQMQASCYSIRFAGGLLGALLGTGVSNQAEWGWGLSFRQVAFINGMLPFLLVVPWLTL